MDCTINYLHDGAAVRLYKRQGHKSDSLFLRHYSYTPGNWWCFLLSRNTSSITMDWDFSYTIRSIFNYLKTIKKRNWAQALTLDIIGLAFISIVM